MKIAGAIALALAGLAWGLSGADPPPPIPTLLLILGTGLLARGDGP